ncbi:hypothetical protein BH09MYX1_BH09MYX1_36090 [soil metagenome]
MATPESVTTKSRSFARWAFVLVPLVGLAELALHIKQTHSVAAPEDWAAAKADVEKNAKPDDLVTFAPKWVDPIGRETFGSALATEAREAYPDVSRFPRAFEVSIRGAHAPDLDGWTNVGEARFGAVTVTTWENPHPITLVDDLLRHIDTPDLHVMLVDGATERECALVHGAAQSGALGAGPATPGTHYGCPNGTNVGITILADLDYNPRRCILAPPPGGQSFIRFRFDNLKLGKAIHGHHAISVHQERNLTGAPVTLAFRVGDRDLGKLVHRDGDGWKPFELDTSDLAGTTAALTVDVSAANGDSRLYCFEADAR